MKFYITIDLSHLCLCCHRISPERTTPRDILTPTGQFLQETYFPSIEEQNHYILDTVLTMISTAQSCVGVKIQVNSTKDRDDLLIAMNSHTSSESLLKYEQQDRLVILEPIR